ncbi:MAG: hypothetical protein OMM_10274 [Candidatus Magnetoglobus multicellularis str. Araruama]|uniref:Uncharacterized protein n=1 Tax=Candidatus Magnetoglobus multicellularis str. Araruama TaxID=890399 RepID=A0A1V1P1J7_9BACT|nr:MAG: hypothetical protein OMM_10274 [Candidatus Magnetoglobus multicellularis str. Araruama]
MFNKENKEEYKRIKVSEESANEQLNDFLEYYDYEGIEDLLDSQNPEDRKIFKSTINSLIRHIKKELFLFLLKMVN